MTTKMTGMMCRKIRIKGGKGRTAICSSSFFPGRAKMKTKQPSVFTPDSRGLSDVIST